VPIYDHLCDHCGHAFSVVQKFSDPPVETCPSCGKRPRRLVTAPAIVFKGSGWYKTDSRSAGSAAKGEAKTEGDTKSDTKSEAKTESKTETKSEPSPSKPTAPAT
jgi:putative FmdB family regulatory protein